MRITRIVIKGNDNSIEERKIRIFQEILRQHVQTAAPVGSRVIARRLRNSLSPATIRNIMADLEEMGFLQHPYTSAGRVPTDEGYRYYVDSLMENMCVTCDEEDEIRSQFENRFFELEEVMHRTSQLLSHYSNQAAVVFFSGLSCDCLKRIALIPLDENLLLVVVVTTSGLVRNFRVYLEESFDHFLAERLTKVLNDELEQMPLSQVEAHLKRKIMMSENDTLHSLYKMGLQIIKATILNAKEERLWLEGARRVLEQPEFEDHKKTKEFLNLLEEKDRLKKLLRENMVQENQGYTIRIGRELGGASFKGYSMVSCRYKVGDRVLGTIGVIGPTRMEYPRTLALVNKIAETLGTTISQMGGV